MRVTFLTVLTLMAAAFYLTVPAYAQQPAEAEWDAAAVDEAVAKAKEYIWKAYKDEGHWLEQGVAKPEQSLEGGPNFGGMTALCTYALLAAGESPQDERMTRAINWLADQKLYGVYARSLRVSAFAVLGKRGKYYRVLQDDVKWLRNAIDSAGTYTYTNDNKDGVDPSRFTHTERWDNSNTQMALLAMRAASQIDPEAAPEIYWKTAEKHWVDTQGKDGGWGYTTDQWPESYGSMTAAGLASLFICFDILHYGEFAGKLIDAEPPNIKKALGWLDGSFDGATNPKWQDPRAARISPYYLYAVERVGLASGYKYFGQKDWYKLGAEALMKAQDSGGAVSGSLDDKLADTCFALLFLARGRHPILFNKLQYDGKWNSRPRDMANVSRNAREAFERDVNWQIINVATPVSEWHDAPMLYISGAGPAKFSDADVNRLRDYVHQGGVIVSECAFNSQEFNRDVRDLYRRLFPNYEPKILGATHPVMNIQNKTLAVRVEGISNGVRLLAVHCPTDLSRSLQLYEKKSDPFMLCTNLYLYVTDKGSLRSRGVSNWPASDGGRPATTVNVARVKWAGNCDPEPLAWKRMGILMNRKYGLGVEATAPIDPAELDATKYPLASITGTGSLVLSAEAKAALRKYIEAGGVVIFDACGGDRDFATSAAQEAVAIIPDSKLERLAMKDPIYTGGGIPIKEVSYRRATREKTSDLKNPRLKGVTVGGKVKIIVSDEDLTAGLVGYPNYAIEGYSPTSAFELMRNVILYASGQTVSATSKPTGGTRSGSTTGGTPTTTSHPTGTFGGEVED